MSVRLYIDHNVPRAIADGLRSRGVVLITSREDGTSEWDDPELLDRAAEWGCVLFTRDYNLLQEATSRQRVNTSFHGVVYAHQLRVSIGDCIRDLEIIAKAGDPEDFMNMVIFLPL